MSNVRWGRIVDSDSVTGMAMASYVGTGKGLLTLLLVVSPLLAADRTPPGLNLTIGRDTTYVDGPVRADGTIDYAAALRARLSEGVTPDNNAATLLLQAFGKSFVEEDHVDDALRLTGLTAMPDEGGTFVSLEDYAQHADRTGERAVGDPVSSQLTEAMEGPWAADDLPLIAGWLAANEKPLALLMEASKRSRFFFLLKPSEDDCVVRLPNLACVRDVLRALQCRAMLRLHDSDVEGAHADALALHRLGRLVAGGGTMIEYLVGVATDRSALHAHQQIVACGRLTADQARRHAEALRRLPPFSSAGKIADEVERCFVLYGAMCLTDPQATGQLAKSSVGATLTLPGFREHRLLLDAGVDWDVVFRDVNQSLDRAIGFMALDAAARAKARDAPADDSHEQQRKRGKILDEGLSAFCRQASQGDG
ncbi:MAG: hypothetical protein ACOC7R_03025, partial [Planctomycetota bacterium]